MSGALLCTRVAQNTTNELVHFGLVVVCCGDEGFFDLGRLGADRYSSAGEIEQDERPLFVSYESDLNGEMVTRFTIVVEEVSGDEGGANMEVLHVREGASGFIAVKLEPAIMSVIIEQSGRSSSKCESQCTVHEDKQYAQELVLVFASTNNFFEAGEISVPQLRLGVQFVLCAIESVILEFGVQFGESFLNRLLAAVGNAGTSEVLANRFRHSERDRGDADPPWLTAAI